MVSGYCPSVFKSVNPAHRFATDPLVIEGYRIDPAQQTYRLRLGAMQGCSQAIQWCVQNVDIPYYGDFGTYMHALADWIARSSTVQYLYNVQHHGGTSYILVDLSLSGRSQNPEITPFPPATRTALLCKAQWVHQHIPSSLHQKLGPGA